MKGKHINPPPNSASLKKKNRVTSLHVSRQKFQQHLFLPFQEGFCCYSCDLAEEMAPAHNEVKQLCDIDSLFSITAPMIWHARSHKSELQRQRGVRWFNNWQADAPDIKNSLTSSSRLPNGVNRHLCFQDYGAKEFTNKQIVMIFFFMLASERSFQIMAVTSTQLWVIALKCMEGTTICRDMCGCLVSLEAWPKKKPSPFGENYASLVEVCALSKFLLSLVTTAKNAMLLPAVVGRIALNLSTDSSEISWRSGLRWEQLSAGLRWRVDPGI